MIWNYISNIGNFASLYKKLYYDDFMFEILKTFPS